MIERDIERLQERIDVLEKMVYDSEDRWERFTDYVKERSANTYDCDDFWIFMRNLVGAAESE